MTRRMPTLSAAVLLLASVPLIAATLHRLPVPRGVAGAVANPERPDDDRARDAERKPAELLAFAGVRPGWKVVELSPGNGYFTRLLSLAVGGRGYVELTGYAR